MKIIKFFDKLEDKIRKRLSRKPLIYALVGSIGIILLWRGIWMLADALNMPGWVSTVLGLLILLAIGLFVSFFIGDQIIISGVKEEKRIDEKTEEEIKREETTLSEIHEDIEKIGKQLKEMKNNSEET